MRALRVLVALLCCTALSCFGGDYSWGTGNGPGELPVGPNVKVPCGHWTKHQVTIASHVELSPAQLEQLVNLVCASVSGAMDQALLEKSDLSDLTDVPFVVQQVVKGNKNNASYGAKTDDVEIGAGLVRPDMVAPPFAIFVLGHELGHRVRHTGYKTVGIRVAGLVAVGGAAIGAVKFRSKKMALASAALAFAGGVALVCPSQFYDGELIADQYGFLVLKAAYKHVGMSEAQATTDALKAAIQYFNQTPQPLDEPCLGDKDETGGFRIRNPNPHPSTARRIANLTKFVKQK